MTYLNACWSLYSTGVPVCVISYTYGTVACPRLTLTVQYQCTVPTVLVIPVFVMTLQQALLYCSRVNLGRCSPGTICTGSTSFHLYTRSSVAHPSKQGVIVYNGSSVAHPSKHGGSLCTPGHQQPTRLNTAIVYTIPSVGHLPKQGSCSLDQSISVIGQLVLSINFSY